MSDSSKAVFLSYAHEDSAAALRIADGLRGLGIEVWFDQSGLRGGDAWDQKIRKEIKECALFLPIISQHTQARGEGYFRLEWKLAVERTHHMAEGLPFLAPVALDRSHEADALVPPEFLRVHWTRLADGVPTAEFLEQIKRLLAAPRKSTAMRKAESAGPQFAASATPQFPATLVAPPQSEIPAGPVLPSAAPEGGGVLRTRLAWFVTIAAVILIGGFGWRATQRKSELASAPEPTAGPTASSVTEKSAASSSEEKSVAVLAFANLSDDKANEYFSDGISEELLNVLAKIPGLKVSARTSAFYFKGKEVPIPEIAKQLGVAYVVEGSVRKAGDKVRITAQLIKATDGFHVWSDTFTRDLRDIFAVQDEIAGLIAKNLELKMGMTAARPTIDVIAYQEYLAGRAAAAKASMTDLREAVTHLERAVAMEPKFASAWAQLASAHTRLGRWGGAPTLQAWPAARAAIARAVALEPDSPDVLLALGWIRRTADWDWRGAEQAFRRALQLQPNQPDALTGAAVLLFNIGQTAEAFRLSQQAARLDPLNASTQVDLGLMFYFSKNWAELERAARRALQLAPGGSYHGMLSWSLSKQKRYTEAEAEARLENDELEQAVALTILALARGQEAMIRECRSQLEAIAQRRGDDTADLQQAFAWIAAALGDKDRAFAALEKARASRDPSMAWLRNEDTLTPLFSDPRWDALLHQMGLADDQLK